MDQNGRNRSPTLKFWPLGQKSDPGPLPRSCRALSCPLPGPIRHLARPSRDPSRPKIDQKWPKWPKFDQKKVTNHQSKMSKMAQNGQNPENLASGPRVDPSRDNSLQPKVMIENFSQISEISKSQKSKMSKMAKNPKFPSSDPLATQSKNTELEELRHLEVIQDLLRSQLKISKITKIVKNLWKFSQNSTKFCQNVKNSDQFRQFWSQQPSDPCGICQDPSALALLFREI